MTGQRRRRNGLLVLGLGMIALATGLTLLVTACGASLFGAIEGSGELTSHDYPFEDFTNVEVSSAFQVTITESDDYSVSVTADDNILELIKVRMSDGTLTIDLDAFVTDVTLKAAITMPALDKLNVSGATQAQLSGFSSTESLSLEASGASAIIGDITAGDARLVISGASKIELEGTAAELVADVSGASHMLLREFRVTHADLVISGASDGVVNLTGRLDADLSGASRLTYIGEPTMGDINTSGAATLRAE